MSRGIAESSENASYQRECIRCQLRALAERDVENIQSYVEAIREQDRATEEEVERRLSVCFLCGKRKDATCEACGCYVEFRAAMRDGRCPKKKW